MGKDIMSDRQHRNRCSYLMVNEKKDTPPPPPPPPPVVNTAAQKDIEAVIISGAHAEKHPRVHAQVVAVTMVF